MLIDFCLIFVPFGHYDEPEILRYAITSICPKGADVRQKPETGDPFSSRKKLANALAVIDGRGSVAAVLDEIATPDHWDEYTCLDAADHLLRAGLVVPATTMFALLDSILRRTENWMHESDRSLLCHVLVLCPFVDAPSAGIAKMRDVINERRFRQHELRELVTALGESRSDAAVDLLYELASDAPTFEQCEDNFINAIAALDTPRSRDLLLGFVDPEIRSIGQTHRLDRENVLAGRLTELAQRNPEVAARLRELCERDLPEFNRHILSSVMGGSSRSKPW